MTVSRNSHRRLVGAICGLGWLAATGCGPGEPADTAPLDLRGQPIAATPSAAAVTNGTTASPPALREGITPVAPPPATIEPDGDGVIQVGFDLLAGYLYPESNEALPADAPPPPTRIPESVRALNDRMVGVQGFMLPMKLQRGLVTELLLMRDQSMCCFGVVPRINEWVNVKMSGRGVKPIQDQPVTIYGTIQVGEIYENGYLVTLYSLNGERMETPLDR